MSKLLLLYSVFLVGILFLILPETITPVDYFLFADIKLHFATHVYFICEKLVLIVLAHIIATEAREYRGAIQIFFWLMVVDLADYLLTYNSVWFHLDFIPVSMNTTKVTIFGLTIIREWIRQL